tara:strand:+ start:541 stop:681 length:141 start_codon:yes stop_codon:yes gene_type:complete
MDKETLISSISFLIEDTHTPQDFEDLQEFSLEELKEIYFELLEEIL